MILKSWLEMEMFKKFRNKISLYQSFTELSLFDANQTKFPSPISDSILLYYYYHLIHTE